MNTKLLVLLNFCSLFLFQGMMNGQVIINPLQSNIPIMSLENLKNVQIINPTDGQVSGTLMLEIKSSNQLLLGLETTPFTIGGNSAINKNEIPWLELVNTPDQSFSYSLLMSSAFREGAYEYCYKFISNEANLLGMRCLENYSIRNAPPELKFPFNQSVINTTTPQLRWLNPMPLFSQELNYAVKLVEVEEGQGINDALTRNLPLLERGGIKTNFYQYTAFDIPLEKGKRYAWNVAAFWEDEFIAETSKWTFTIDEDRPVNTVIKEESFRSLKPYADGTSYLFTDKMYIRYYNKNNSSVFNYSIFEKGSPDKPVKKTPEIAISSGLNQITFDLKPLKLKKDVQYVLQVKGDNNSFSYLQFSVK